MNKNPFILKLCKCPCTIKIYFFQIPKLNGNVKTSYKCNKKANKSNKISLQSYNVPC